MTQLEMTAHHQHVFCRVADWQGASMGFGIIAPDQTIGRRDKSVVLEVVCAGPGNVSRGALNPCQVRHGQLVVANLYHRSNELVVVGEGLSTFNWEQIMASIDIDEERRAIDVRPLQCFIVCRADERRAQRVIMGDKRIIAPYGDAQYTGGSEYDERGKPRVQMKSAVEEVVSVGPGAVVDGMWQEPQVRPGDMVMYDTSVSPVRFVAGGQGYTLLHYRHVLASFRDVAPESYDRPIGGLEAVSEEEEPTLLMGSADDVNGGGQANGT